MYQGFEKLLLPRQGGESIDGASEIDDAPPAPISQANIKCETHLGGLLKRFYRKQCGRQFV